MGVTVKIPTQLRSVTGGESEAVVDEATTVGEVLDGLYDRFDGLKERIAEDGDLRRFVNVYVQGEDIRFLDGLETSVDDGDEVTILPAVAGGAPPPLLPACLGHPALPRDRRVLPPALHPLFVPSPAAARCAARLRRASSPRA